MLHAKALEQLLEGIPQDVWQSVWHPNSTRMLCRASKSMHGTVRKLRLPDADHMSRDWWLKYAGLPSPTKWVIALEGLHKRTASANLTSIALHCGSQASALVHFFQVHPHLHPTLQRFSITSSGNLGPIGTADVAHALRTCTAITDLDLCHNDMRLQGVRTLRPALATFSHLRRLTLAKNALGDKVL